MESVLRIIAAVFCVSAAAGLTGCAGRSETPKDTLASVNLVANRLVSGAIEPSFLHDTNLILFTSYAKGKEFLSDIVIYDKRRNTSQTLTSNSWYDGNPAIGSDQNLVVFTSNFESQRNIWMLDRTTGELYRVTTSGGFDACWHPTEPVILYTTATNDRLSIVAQDITDGVRRTLIADLFNNYQASWASNGRHIVFVSDRDGDDDIYLRDVQTNTTQRLTDLPGNERFPTLSPDMNLLLFSSDHYPVPTIPGQHGDRVNLWAADVRNPDNPGVPVMVFQNELFGAKTVHPHFSADNRTVLFATNASGLNYEIIEIDLPDILKRNAEAGLALPVQRPATQTEQVVSN